MLLRSDVPGLVPRRGKVRDIYDLGKELVIVATDRISAFDVVMANGIPNKGRILTQLSKFWFDFLDGLVGHHLLTDRIDQMPAPFNRHRELEGRTMLVKKAKVLPVECIVRGYLVGSGWKEYKATGTVCGIRLPAGLRLADKLPEPIFTPSTKAEQGQHDQNVSFQQCVDMVGRETAEFIRQKSIEIFAKAGQYAASRGLLIADTKFEWGIADDGRIILVDEVLTPDSSRFWPADRYQPGRDQESFDKQFVRDYLERIGFDKSGPGVVLPDEVVQQTAARYLEAYQRLTGRVFSG
jgi:phosphoribosylaminoimidazole-succinocarboxamide synthase